MPSIEVATIEGGVARAVDLWTEQFDLPEFIDESNVTEIERIFNEEIIGCQTDPCDVEAAFTAFVGHKEACSEPPPGAVVLATSGPCPVQAYRVGENAYVTQFHPELDLEGIILRIYAYGGYGYFAPDETDATIAASRRAPVEHPSRMLRNFVEM